GGKGRTLRLDISDNFSQDNKNEDLQGKLKRFWFLVQTLRCASIDRNSRPMAISFNQSAGKMTIEYTQVDSTSESQEAFVKLVTILSGLASMDVSLNKFNRSKNTNKWHFETLVKKSQNGLDEPINNWIFKHCLVLDAITTRFMPQEFHYDYTFLDYLDGKYKLFFEMAEKAYYQLMRARIPDRDAELRQILTAMTKHLQPNVAARITNELLAHMAIETGFLEVFIPILREEFDLDHDRERVLFLVQQNPRIFSYIADRFNDDKEIVKSAVEQQGNLLSYASNRLKNDLDVVLSAIRNYSPALSLAGPMVKNDEALLKRLIEENPYAHYFVSLATESLKNDKDFVLPLLSRDAFIYEFLSDRLKSDPDIQAAIRNQDDGFRK
ncbi:DUF4116 domain-containing protein, partial [Endozoicomonas sp. SESOKO3]|uniref:DUF4116 domain-containing protein n=1 Tax=Endozoicomonas sp. SESOKO3 TaxID=2828744 RepID=UPI0021477529